MPQFIFDLFKLWPAFVVVASILTLSFMAYMGRHFASKKDVDNAFTKIRRVEDGHNERLKALEDARIEANTHFRYMATKEQVGNLQNTMGRLDERIKGLSHQVGNLQEVQSDGGEK